MLAADLRSRKRTANEMVEARASLDTLANGAIVLPVPLFQRKLLERVPLLLVWRMELILLPVPLSQSKLLERVPLLLVWRMELIVLPVPLSQSKLL
jgi:hypothetical protein